MTATASGSSSAAAVLNPVNPSIATTSTRSRQSCGRPASHVLKAALERPSTMSSSRAGPVPSRIGVRSMMTVTYLSPLRVCRHTCSSTPRTVTPSNRSGSPIRIRCPSARTASLAVCHATPRPSATRDTVRCCTTSPTSAHRSPARETFALGSAARVVSCRHTCPQPPQRYRRTTTSSSVGRHPSGSCASRRTTVSRGAPSQPQRRHHWSGSTTRQASTARSDSSRCPMTSRPSSSSRQNVVMSGQANSAREVASGTSGPSRMASVRTSILGRPRPQPPDRRASRRYTLTCEEPDCPPSSTRQS